MIASNQTISAGVYDVAVRVACNLPEDFISAHQGRITAAYTMGEPVWMIADELRLRYQMRPFRPTKSPRALAVRVVRA